MDLHSLARAARELYLLLKPDLTIVDASDAYLCAALSWRDEVEGRSVFEAFPDNARGGSASGVRNLRDSFKRVLGGGPAEHMPMQRHDMRDHVSGRGTWVQKFWLATNSPLCERGGSEVTHLLHEIDDVSQEVSLRHSLLEQSSANAEQIASLERLRHDPSCCYVGEDSFVAGRRWDLPLMRQQLEQREDELRESREPLEDVLGGRTRRADLPEAMRRRLEGESRYFTAGDRVAVAGIYRSYHADGCGRRGRRLRRNEPVFPACPGCAGAVRYRLIRRI